MAMSVPTLTKTWSDGQVVTAAHLNGNFTTIRDYLNTSGGALNAANTWTALQTHSAGLTVSAGGVAVTGNSTITGTLSGITTLAIGGTLTGVTSLTMAGTLAGVTTISGTPNFSGTPTFGAGFTVTAGTVTFAGLTVNGNLTLSGTSRKVIGSTTSTLFRNTADSETWLSYTESGEVVAIAPTGGDVVVGAATLAQGATTGFLRLPIQTAIPNGAATDGCISLGTDGKLYARLGSAWISIQLS
jgi:hypothetical protein